MINTKPITEKFLYNDFNGNAKQFFREDKARLDAGETPEQLVRDENSADLLTIKLAQHSETYPDLLDHLSKLDRLVLDYVEGLEG